MRRTDRLFEIIQLFRSDKLLLAREIAIQLEVSVRTIYRDIDTLIASGVPIEGERGVGYILRAPIFLSPLTFTNAELEALHLGMKIVQQSTDIQLAKAAKQLIKKIDAVIPNEKRLKNHLVGLSVFSSEQNKPLPYLADLRLAIAKKYILDIEYEKLSGIKSKRRIRPLHMEYWGQVWTCTSWCELRNNFRVFRIDRMKICLKSKEIFSDELGKTYKDYLSQMDREG